MPFAQIAKREIGTLSEENTRKIHQVVRQTGFRLLQTKEYCREGSRVVGYISHKSFLEGFVGRQRRTHYYGRKIIIRHAIDLDSRGGGNPFGKQRQETCEFPRDENGRGVRLPILVLSPVAVSEVFARCLRLHVNLANPQGNPDT